MKNIINKIMCVFITFFCVFTYVNAGEVKIVNSESDFNSAVNSGAVVVADFFATWCPPCKMLAPVLEELAKDYKDKVVFLKIDVDKKVTLAQKYAIQAIPDVRIFKGKKELEKILGFHKKSHYSKIIDKLITK